ncbi:MAG: holo-ACP synthase [Clostridium sp.]|uniref:holo-ACP synthase n=1 Tax=Clostridium sp. TaxID=1506 RepID=UPI00290ABCDE|nr:holo-ACP synthase [Clostridium sp.]MDU7339068.1 holo-ACP synthase [Clostridium sp.]
MLSVGVDLVEIARVEHAMRNPRFCRRILGSREYEQLSERGFPAASVAVSFCAKEAFSKALGTGVRGFLLSEVQLLRDELGKPFLFLEGAALKAARNMEFTVSATHTDRYASVTVIGEERHSNEGIRKRRHAGAGRKSSCGRNQLPRTHGKRGFGGSANTAGESRRSAHRHIVRKGQ